jgi:LmbE family N-acetylglucosaminyl deacetylase
LRRGWIDAHPDHIATSKICDAARFYGKLTKTEMQGSPFYVKKIYYYIASHLKLNFKPSFVIDISKEMEMKIETIRCYESQFGPSPEGHQLFEWVLNSNRYWGNLINTEFAEPFICRDLSVVKKLVSKISRHFCRWKGMLLKFLKISRFSFLPRRIKLFLS